MKTAMLFPIALAIAAVPARAEDPTPGLWQISLETRATADAGWTPSPFSITQCVTAADARDPSRLIASVATPGATGCNYTERNYSGSTFRFAVECAGSYAIRSRGSVTFGATSFEGTMTATANLAGQSTEFQNKISAKRVGGC